MSRFLAVLLAGTAAVALTGTLIYSAYFSPARTATAGNVLPAVEPAFHALEQATQGQAAPPVVAVPSNCMVLRYPDGTLTK